MYVGGHHRGLLSLYKYATDKLLLKKAAEFLTSPNISLINNRGSQIKKVKFNSYGDKFATNDHDGNCLLYTSPSPRDS